VIGKRTNNSIRSCAPHTFIYIYISTHTKHKYSSLVRGCSIAMASINRENNDADHNLIQSLLSKEISTINEHQHEDEDEQEFGKKVWIETKKLWHIVGPSIFSRVASFTMNVVTQAFAGHLGDVQLASISIANTVIVGFNFGLLVSPLTVILSYICFHNNFF